MEDQATVQQSNLRQIIWLCLAFAALKVVQVVGNVLAQRAGYGIFRDEMYTT